MDSLPLDAFRWVLWQGEFFRVLFNAYACVRVFDWFVSALLVARGFVFWCLAWLRGLALVLSAEIERVRSGSDNRMMRWSKIRTNNSRCCRVPFPLKSSAAVW